MKNQIVLLILITSLFWILGCYVYVDLTKEKCVDCNSLIEENVKNYQIQLLNLQLVRDSLKYEVSVANSKIDSLNNSISSRNKELNKLRKKYNETIASIDGMSNDELSKFFTDRYNK
jgi:hypothetical protein